MEYVIGQRWISNAETELGLGIVSRVEHRHVTISFPAAAEERVYAKDTAPISRITYRAGDVIETIDGDKLTIIDLSEQAGYITYHCLNTLDDDVDLEEVELDCFIQLSKPLDRLLAGQVDKPSDYQLRLKALSCQKQIDSLDSTGLIGPRVQLLPHQLYIAHEIGNRFAPRVLLADEVGLGKTIEAGLILHRQLIKGLASRVLVVVPETLVHQWLVEMLRRFNLQFSLLDEQRCLAIEESQEANPFESEQLVICPLSLFTKNAARLEQAKDSGWDTIIVDEAHHLEWHPNDISPEYEAVETLSAASSSVILLTATPEQLGIDGHFARLKLLDPDRYFDLEKFIEEQNHYREINQLVELIDSENAIAADSQEAKLLESTLPGRSLETLNNSETGSDYRQACIQELLDQFGTGRVLFRNTRKTIEGFPGRQLVHHPLASDSTDSGVEADPRTVWLVDWLKQNRSKKTLVICHEAETAVELQQYLYLRKGITSAAFHDHLSLIERDRAAAYFADFEDGAQVLVCSEIGSEGRNFQFSQDLVMFDLPQNPDLLEQRIGRLDRIGQRSTIQIHVPTIADSNSEKRLNWYHNGLNAFEKTCVAASRLYRELGVERIENTISEGTNLNALITEAQEKLAAIQAEMDNGSDHMLQLNSCRPEVAEPIIEELEALNDTPDLRGFLKDAFDYFGVDQERHSEDAIVIHPSDHMQVDHIPGLPEDGLTATYDRDNALSRDDLVYLNWEHPLVRSILELILNGERGNSTVNTVKLKPLKPGSVLVEATYRLQCSAPGYQKLGRYFDETLLRLMLDNQGRNLTAALPSEQLDRLIAPVKTVTARQIIKSTKDVIEATTKTMDEIVAKKQPDIVETAQSKASEEMDKEIKRLTDLSRNNPNIRQYEIDYLVEQKAQVLRYLESSSFQLDALRIIVAT